jgi:hypothetical protein
MKNMIFTNFATLSILIHVFYSIILEKFYGQNANQMQNLMNINPILHKTLLYCNS